LNIKVHFQTMPIALVISGPTGIVLMVIVVVGCAVVSWLKVRDQLATLKPRQQGPPTFDDFGPLPRPTPVPPQATAEMPGSPVYEFNPESLQKARQMLEKGTAVDVVCATINPAYTMMNQTEQRCYRMMLKITLRNP
jgi:hypothetical protein